VIKEFQYESQGVSQEDVQQMQDRPKKAGRQGYLRK
jgi:hypothetical protein